MGHLLGDLVRPTGEEGDAITLAVPGSRPGHAIDADLSGW
ncbi:hypothetical protein KPATCC21470_2061 [Kitasatospora purpeofusca]